MTQLPLQKAFPPAGPVECLAQPSTTDMGLAHGMAALPLPSGLQRTNHHHLPVLV